MIINGTPAGETLNGTPQDDVINGLAGDDLLYGRGGNDLLDGGDGSDTMHGGVGDDDIHVGEAGIDVAYGGEGNDEIYGGRRPGELGSLRAFGGAGDDLVEGTDGGDSIQGDAGLDTLRGEAGDDRIVYDAADPTVDGGGGRDTLVLPTGSGVTFVNLFSGDQIGGGGGASGFENIDASKMTTGIELYGDDYTTGANVIVTGSGNDLMDAHGAGDTINLGRGDDGQRYYSSDVANAGGAGTDILFIHESNTIVDLAATADQVAGGGTTTGFENVLLDAGNSGTTVTGDGRANQLIDTGFGSGNTFSGAGGKDTLDGGRNADTLLGGAGADTFVYHDLVDFGDSLPDFQSGSASTSVDQLRIEMAGIPVGDGDTLVENVVNADFPSGVPDGTEIFLRLANGLNEGQIDGFVGALGVTNPLLFVSKMDPTATQPTRVAVWYDSDPSQAGGTVQLADDLPWNQNYDASDFLFA